MKTNYINQLQRQLMQDENFHCMPDDEQPIKSNTPIVEDVSMEDASEIYTNNNLHNKKLPNWENRQNDFKAGWQQREQQLLPIIKELRKALKESWLQLEYINLKFKETGTTNNTMTKIQTTLDKYKNYF